MLGAIGGAAVALAAVRLRAQNGASAEPEAEESQGAKVPHQVSTVEDLRELLPLRTGGSGIEDAPKVLDHLDDQMLGFIERSPFLQLGTADEDFPRKESFFREEFFGFPTVQQNTLIL